MGKDIRIEKISTNSSICGDGGKASQRKHCNKKIQTNSLKYPRQLNEEFANVN